MRTAREVISPNVCRVFDLQELQAQELVAMEYVDGTTLQEILRDESPLELDEAREIASQFLAGLEAIHAAGLVHRDIKPENLMITRTGRVVVMDFGLAKGLGDGRGGRIAGTPAYMSPEQERGGELDARADVFAAGVVLAEMVEPGGVRTPRGPPADLGGGPSRPSPGFRHTLVEGDRAGRFRGNVGSLRVGLSPGAGARGGHPPGRRRRDGATVSGLVRLPAGGRAVLLRP